MTDSVAPNELYSDYDPAHGDRNVEAYTDTLRKYTAPSHCPEAVEIIKFPTLEHDVTIFDLDGAAGSLRTMQALVGARNTKAGWRHNPVTGYLRTRDVAELAALAHTEISEAFEGHRRGDRMDDKLPHRKMEEVEIADAIYRLLDWADERGLDVGGAFAEKMAYNILRADHKKENRLAEGGKKI